jgi:hypothetical protein
VFILFLPFTCSEQHLAVVLVCLQQFLLDRYLVGLQCSQWVLLGGRAKYSPPSQVRPLDDRIRMRRATPYRIVNGVCVQQYRRRTRRLFRMCGEEDCGVGCPRRSMAWVPSIRRSFREYLILSTHRHPQPRWPRSRYRRKTLPRSDQREYFKTPPDRVSRRQRPFVVN